MTNGERILTDLGRIARNVERLVELLQGIAQVLERSAEPSKPPTEQPLSPATKQAYEPPTLRELPADHPHALALLEQVKKGAP